MPDEGFELYASTMSSNRANRHRNDHAANQRASDSVEFQVRERQQFLKNGANALGETIKTVKLHLDELVKLDPKVGESEKVNMIAFLKGAFEFIDPSLTAKPEVKKDPEPPVKKTVKKASKESTKASD